MRGSDFTPEDSERAKAGMARRVELIEQQDGRALVVMARNEVAYAERR